jgi:phage gp36-like protein
MAYCVQADVERRVGGAAKLVQLTAAPGGTVADAAVVTAAIAEADTMIDSYAHKRFAVPFAAPIPSRIVTLSARIAARALRQWRQMPLPTDVDDEKVDIDWLKGLAKGEVDPGVEPSSTPSSMVTDTAEERESTKEVSRESMKGFW